MQVNALLSPFSDAHTVTTKPRPTPEKRRLNKKAFLFSPFASLEDSDPVVNQRDNSSSLTKKMPFSQCLKEMRRYGGDSVVKAHQKWLKRRGFADVHNFVKGVDHHVLYNLEPEEIDFACKNTDHSLGHMDKASMQKDPLFRDVNNFNVPFAYMHLMHMLMEKRGRMPLWKDVLPFFYEEVPDFYVNFYRKAFSYDSIHSDKRKLLDSFVEWRLGLAYYNFLREVDVFSKLRKQHGIDLKYHVFADVTLKTDFWMDGAIISLYISNPSYKSKYNGRKMKAEEFYASSQKLKFVNIVLEKRSTFGHVWRVPDHQIKTAAYDIVNEGVAKETNH